MKYLAKRSGSSNFYARVPVPAGIQKKLGKKEVWKSLGTSSQKEANRRLHKVVAEIQSDFAARTSTLAGEKPLIEPSDESLEAAAIEFYNMLVENDQEERAADTEEILLSWVPRGNKATLKAFQSQFAIGDFSEVDDVYWAGEFGFELIPESPKGRRFAQLLMRARIEAQRREVDLDKGRIGKKPDDPLFRKPPATSYLSQASPAAPFLAEKRTLHELFAIYKVNMSSSLKPDTLVQKEKPLKRFIQFVGEELDVNEYTKAHAREWRNALRKWPKLADQRKVFEGLGFNEVILKNKTLNLPLVGEISISKYMSEVSALFSWMVREGYVDNNIFDGLHINVRKDSAEERAISDSQLVELIAAPLFAGCRGKTRQAVREPGSILLNDWRFWLPILSLFTGARQAELAQLEVLDVGEVADIPFIRITDRGIDPNKSTKTKSSDREVPLHPTLIELGFLQYVKRVRKSGNSRVFPEIKRDTRNSFSTVSKFFQPYFRKLRTKEITGESVVFHSLRHRFVDELRKRYTDDQIKPLIGHANSGVTGSYGVRASLQVPERYKMIETIDYSMIDWPSISRS